MPGHLTDSERLAFDRLIAVAVLGLYLTGWLTKRVFYPACARDYQKQSFKDVFPKLHKLPIGLLTRNGDLPAAYSVAITLKFSVLCILCSVIISLDLQAVPDSIRTELQEMFVHGGWKYLGFLLLGLFILSRVYLTAKRSDEPRQIRAVWWLIGIALATSLYYESILAFARNVYPHIPSARGGGDYSEASLMELHFDVLHANSIPENLLVPEPNTNEVRHTRPLVLIEANNNELFVADPKEPLQGGRQAWKKEYIPNIIAVRRDQVLYIQYLGSK
jgi:hypothetical protein